MRPGGDRLVGLAGLLAARGLSYSVARIGEARHAFVRVGEGRPSLALVAHYDRAPGSPGALDNSCACIQLADFASRRGAAPLSRVPILVAFTDAEEAPGSGGPDSQGSFALARALAQGARGSSRRAEGMSALVLDVTGRGGRLVLSRTPAELLERHGLERSEAAAGHRALLELARRSAASAGLEQPLEASLPWSDDLGLTLGGLPALALSLLPEDQAILLAGGLKPPLWDLLHTEADVPELAEERAFETIAAFLDALARELAG